MFPKKGQTYQIVKIFATYSTNGTAKSKHSPCLATDVLIHRVESLRKLNFSQGAGNMLSRNKKLFPSKKEK